MPRAPRIDYPGAFHHITARGNGRQPIYLDDADRLKFLELLGEVGGRCQWRCHAYCLMTTHYHLAVETPAGNLAVGMHALNGRYARWFNRRHDRLNHLFGSRYRAEPIRRDAHLLATARYIALNPVRAGLCEHPALWPWSSYAATAGLRSVPSFLAMDAVHGLLGPDRVEAEGRFADYVLAEVDPAVADAVPAGRAFRA